MRVIPVIDLKGGLVVRGVAGERSRYRPVVSVLGPDPSPGSIAAAFAAVLGLGEVYVADLDAIAGREPDWAAYEQIAAAGLRLWVDAGIGEAGRARQKWPTGRRPVCRRRDWSWDSSRWTIPRNWFRSMPRCTRTPACSAWISATANR